MGSLLSRLLHDYSGGALGIFRRCPRRQREVSNENEEPRAQRRRVDGAPRGGVGVTSEDRVTSEARGQESRSTHSCSSATVQGHRRPREVSSDDGEPRARRQRLEPEIQEMERNVPNPPVAELPEYDLQAAPIATVRAT